MSVSSPAYVLHRRPYQNTSLIVHLLTREHGRVDAVAQGAQRVSKGKQRFALAFFQELNVQCKGQSELLSLYRSESTSHPILLTGKALFCALYVNELLSHCLPRHEEVLAIYALYQHTLNELHTHANSHSDNCGIEWVLRRFELCLLNELGYGIQFAVANTGQVLADEHFYVYHLGSGFMPASNAPTALKGSDLNCIVQVLEAEDASHPNFDTARITAKHLLRPIISSLLGGKPLKSRELFIYT